jgi:hypothetical protein
MRRFLLALLAALAGLLLMPVGAAAQSGPADPAGARDARAAAGKAGAASIKDGATTAASWYTGTVAAGATQTWTWNNANPLGSGYKVGFSPVGASTTAICQFGVERSWYSQRSTGERRFHFVLKNKGTIACGATVLLAQATGGTIGTTGWLAPGASEHWYWNIHDVIGGQSVQLVGLSPIGAVGVPRISNFVSEQGTTCELEPTPESYVQRITSTGAPMRQFYLGVRNIGPHTCLDLHVYLPTILA